MHDESMIRPEPGTTRAKLLHSTVVHLLVLAVVALIAYSNSFHVPFIFDDESSITKNELIRDLANFFSNPSGYEDHPNRFIGYLTFAVNYNLGGLNVVGYHVVNLAIHIANGLLVYALVRLTLGTPFFVKGAGERQPRAGGEAVRCSLNSGPWSLLPAFAALLFVSHPVQTQAVTYIVQRLTSLATFFFLGAIVLYICWRTARAAGAPFRSMRVLPAFFCSLLAAVMAMKTKEIAFTLPLVVLLYEFSFFGRPRMRQLAELSPVLLTMPIIPLTMLTLHKPVGEIISDVSKATAEGITLSRWEYLCTQFGVIVTYLRLLLLPINQNFDYDYPISHSLLDPRAFLSCTLLLAILASAAWAWRRSSGTIEAGSELRLAGFGIFWFFLTLAVESSVIPITDVIYEHRLYLPSIGFILAAVSLVPVMARRLRASIDMFVLPALFAVVLILMLATHARNEVWTSWETLWKDVQKKSPMKARSYNNLGAYYARLMRPAEAIPEFEMAVRLDPQYLDPLYNLGLLYSAAGRHSEAIQIYAKLMKLDPENFKNLGVVPGDK